MYSVSVIIPLYNVETYIERCARSLFEQTLDDIEYIIIDDGSTDNSMQKLYDVLSEYPRRRDDVIVFRHEKNKGVAFSRIEGYHLAHGEYVIHCDSDDYVDNRIYEILYSTAQSGEYDMVVCDVCSVYGDGTINIEKGKSGEDIMNSILGSSDYLWNKLVRRSIVQDKWITPPNFDMSEDLVLSVQYALLADKVGYVNEALYYYVHRDTSILGVRTVDAMLRKQREFHGNFDVCIAVLKEKDKYGKYKSDILQKMYYIKNYAQTLLGLPNVYTEWIRTYPELNYLIFSRSFSIKQKLSYFLTLAGLYPLIIKLRGGSRQ